MSTTKNTIDLSGLSKQYASRDLPSHTKLKYRESGQAAPEDIRRDKKDLKRELEEKERLSKDGSSSGSSKRLSLTDRDAEKSKKLKIEASTVQPVNLDADEVLPDSSDDEDEDRTKKRHQESDEDSDNSDESDEDDDEDDTEALMAELNRIKQERAAEAAKQEEERKAREEKIRVENILKGNPLLGAAGNKAPGASATVDFKVKKRWDDDVVFKNCAKMDENKKKGFVNDTLRSEFHKKFMDRYIK